MSNSKITKQALVICLVSLFLCIAMLIGTTFAWFTDSVSSESNRIKSGNLQVELYKYNGSKSDSEIPILGEDWAKINNHMGTDEIFGDEFKNWAPGTEKTVYLAVKNNGSLELQFDLDFVVHTDALAEALLFGYQMEKMNLPTIESPVTLVAEALDANNTISIVDGENLTIENNIEYIAISFKMPLGAGESYLDSELSIDVVLTASQASGNIIKAYTVEDINSAAENSSIVLMKDIIDFDHSVQIENKFFNLDLKKHILVVSAFTIENASYGTMDIKNGSIIANGDISISVPNGSLNLLDLNFVIYEDNNICLDASKHTLSMVGNVCAYECDNVVGLTEDVNKIADLENNCRRCCAYVSGETKVSLKITSELWLRLMDSNITVEDVRPSDNQQELVIYASGEVSGIVIYDKRTVSIEGENKRFAKVMILYVGSGAEVTLHPNTQADTIIVSEPD